MVVEATELLLVAAYDMTPLWSLFMCLDSDNGTLRGLVQCTGEGEMLVSWTCEYRKPGTINGLYCKIGDVTVYGKESPVFMGVAVFGVVLYVCAGNNIALS